MKPRINIYSTLGCASVTFCWVDSPSLSRLSTCLKLMRELQKLGVQIVNVNGWTKTFKIHLDSKSMEWLRDNKDAIVYGNRFE